jgi:hypothetical protein
MDRSKMELKGKGQMRSECQDGKWDESVRIGSNVIS